MNNKKWAVIDVNETKLIDGVGRCPVEYCDSLQQAYSILMRKLETEKKILQIAKIIEINEVEIKEKREQI